MRIKSRRSSSMASGPFRGGQDMISPVFHTHRPRPWTSSHAFASHYSYVPLRCYRIYFQALSAREVHFKVHLSKSISLFINDLTLERCTDEAQIFGGEADRGGPGVFPRQPLGAAA